MLLAGKLEPALRVRPNQYVSKSTGVETHPQRPTDNSRFTPEDHAVRLRAAGFPVQPEHIYTSALATARFVELQKPRSSAIVIGDHGVVEALQRSGCRITEITPISWSSASPLRTTTSRSPRVPSLWHRARGFSPPIRDRTGPTERGFHPACGAVAALIEKATGRQPYFVGKPNPFMMRSALDRLGVRAADTIIVGDRMDTDVLAGLESGLKTVFVLTGITTQADIVRFPFRPDHVVECLANLGQITMWE